MNGPSKFVVGLVAAAFVMPLPAGAQEPPQGTIVERVLVRVNGEIFTQSQLTMRQVEALRAKQGDNRDDAKLQASLAEITPEVLVSAVDELLLVQRGREIGVKFTEDQFKEALDGIKKDNKLDDAGLKIALAQEGLTLEELREQMERTFLIRAVQQREIGPSMSITQEEERQYYAKHTADFMTPLTVTLREILVQVATSAQKGQNLFSVSDDSTAKTRIDAARARIVAGEDFTKLVTEVSESATKSSGGLIGPVDVEDLTPALREALASLQPGGITLPIRGPRGYQIFKLETRSTQELRGFDAVRQDVERAIRDERLDPETEKMKARLRTQAVIEWKDEGFKHMYEKRVAEKTGPSPLDAPAPAK